MLDDFLMRAFLGGIGVALVTGPLGCFIVWRKMAYFGDTLAHAGLLGVTLAFVLEINLTVAVFATSIAITLALLYLQKNATLSSDALLGLLSHSALAIGLVILSFLTWIRFDLMSLLIGDILSISKLDIALIWGGGALVLCVLALIWRPLFAGTVNRDLAIAEGLAYERAHLIFVILLSLVIAIAIKIVGVLLITALLIIPAAAARRFVVAPEQMVFVAMILGVVAVNGGLLGSLQFDVPAGPFIVIACLCTFILSLSPMALFVKRYITARL